MTTSSDKLLSIARESGASVLPSAMESYDATSIIFGATATATGPELLATFAERIRQEEREKAAGICAAFRHGGKTHYSQGWDDACSDCEEAIRSISTTESKAEGEN